MAKIIEPIHCAATRGAMKQAIEERRSMIRSWYCDKCAVEVYDRCCPHCGKTKRQQS